AQTAAGKVAMLALFGFGIRFFLADFMSSLQLAILLAVITFMPEYRRFVLALCPIVFLVTQSSHQYLVLGLTLAVVAFGICLYLCSMRWPKSLFGQRPLVFLLSG